jgi:hypothetical protein
LPDETGSAGFIRAYRDGTERWSGRALAGPGRCDTAAIGLNDRGQIVIAAAGTTDGTTCPPQAQ